MLTRFLVHVNAFVGDRCEQVKFCLNAPSARVALEEAEQEAEAAGYESPTASHVIPFPPVRP